MTERVRKERDTWKRGVPNAWMSVGDPHQKCVVKAELRLGNEWMITQFLSWETRSLDYSSLRLYLNKATLRWPTILRKWLLCWRMLLDFSFTKIWVNIAKKTVKRKGDKISLQGWLRLHSVSIQVRGRWRTFFSLFLALKLGLLIASYFGRAFRSFGLRRVANAGLQPITTCRIESFLLSLGNGSLFGQVSTHWVGEI